MSDNSIDIEPPEIPSPSQPAPEKKGFFGRKKSSEEDILRDQIVTKKKPSIQAAFEERAAQESGVDLEEKVAPARDNPPLLTFKGGKRVLTLTDLQAAIAEASPEDFKRLQKDGTYGLFIKRFLFHPELAGKVQSAVSKQEAIAAVAQTLKPRAEHIDIVPEEIDSGEPEDHFSRLREQHEESMESLKNSLEEGVEETSVDIIRQALSLKDKQTAETLYDVAEAIGMMSDDAFDDLMLTRKADVKAYIIELARKCARIAHIKPVELQARLIKDLEEHDELITKKIGLAESELEELQAELQHRADSLDQVEKSLFQLKDDLVNEEDRLDQVREKMEEEFLRREEVVVAKEDALQADEKRFDDVKKSLEAANQELLEEKSSLEAVIAEKKESLRQLELHMVDEKKALELRKHEVLSELDERRKGLDQLESVLQDKETAFEADKQTFETAMRKRESLVQETVDKILSVDKDIHEQREEIDKLKDEIDHGGFKDYLENALREVSTDHIPLKDDAEKEFEEHHESISKIIHECNDAIESKSFSQAKKLYAQLKNMYENEKLSQQEKDLLYDAIRELYANLHLAMLDG